MKKSGLQATYWRRLPLVISAAEGENLTPDAFVFFLRDTGPISGSSLVPNRLA